MKNYFLINPIVKSLNTLQKNGYGVITTETLKWVYWIRVNKIKKGTLRYYLKKLVKVGKLIKVGRDKYKFTNQEITLSDFKRKTTIPIRVNKTIKKFAEFVGKDINELDNSLQEEYEYCMNMWEMEYLEETERLKEIL